jgi:hypothetical protein
MMPLITESQYKCILKQTVVTQLMTARLWSSLSYMKATYHLKCVGLLHHLHNIVPRPKDIEKIIAKDLNNVDTYQRFTLLWHLSRDLTSKSNSKDQTRTFDICLLKMLDNLNMTSGPLKILSQSWLVHAMTRGDVGRIMEPLFLTLLDPSTARVSVLHCKLEMMEDEVFAIGFEATEATEDVIYHVINNRDNTSNYIKQYNKRIKVKTLSKKAVKAASKINDLGALNIEVNPFALVPPDLEDYDSYTKGYNRDSTTASEASSVASTPSMMSLNESAVAYDLAAHILDQIVGEAVTASEAAVEDRATPGVHPLHSHLLLYTQVSDSRQVLYTLECIKNILKSNARLAICALSTTNLNSRPSPRSHQVQILLARHRKSVFGKAFVGDLNNENMATHRYQTKSVKFRNF